MSGTCGHAHGHGHDAGAGAGAQEAPAGNNATATATATAIATATAGMTVDQHLAAAESAWAAGDGGNALGSYDAALALAAAANDRETEVRPLASLGVYFGAHPAPCLWWRLKKKDDCASRLCTGDGHPLLLSQSSSPSFRLSSTLAPSPATTRREGEREGEGKKANVREGESASARAKERERKRKRKRKRKRRKGRREGTR